jgi:hypothetical protein
MQYVLRFRTLIGDRGVRHHCEDFMVSKGSVEWHRSKVLILAVRPDEEASRYLDLRMQIENDVVNDCWVCMLKSWRADA